MEIGLNGMNGQIALWPVEEVGKQKVDHVPIRTHRMEVTIAVVQPKNIHNAMDFHVQVKIIFRP